MCFQHHLTCRTVLCYYKQSCRPVFLRTCLTNITWLLHLLLRIPAVHHFQERTWHGSPIPSPAISKNLKKILSNGQEWSIGLAFCKFLFRCNQLCSGSLHHLISLWFRSAAQKFLDVRFHYLLVKWRIVRYREKAKRYFIFYVYCNIEQQISYIFRKMCTRPL